MIPILVWLAGCLGMAWLITAHHFWRDGLAACAVFTWVLWVLGGAAFISAKNRVGLSSAGRRAQLEKEQLRAAAAAAEKQREAKP